MIKKEFETMRQTIVKTVVPTNYLKISLSYLIDIVLPYNKGLIFLESLNTAEMIKDSISKGLVPIDGSLIRTEIMSQEMYLDYKMATLLNISIKEILEMKKELETK